MLGGGGQCKVLSSLETRGLVKGNLPAEWLYIRHTLLPCASVSLREKAKAIAATSSLRSLPEVCRVLLSA